MNPETRALTLRPDPGHALVLTGDIRVSVFVPRSESEEKKHSKKKKRKKLKPAFSFWFHTSMEHYEHGYEPLVLPRNKVDGVRKAKNKAQFPPDFRVEVHFRSVK